MHMSTTLSLTVTGTVKGATSSVTHEVDFAGCDDNKNKPTSRIGRALKTLVDSAAAYRMTKTNLTLNWNGRESSFAFTTSQSPAKVAANFYVVLTSVIFGEAAYLAPTASVKNDLAILIAKIFGLKRPDGITPAEFSEVTKMKFQELLTFEEIQRAQVRLEFMEHSLLPVLQEQLKKVRRDLKDQKALKESLPQEKLRQLPTPELPM